MKHRAAGGAAVIFACLALLMNAGCDENKRGVVVEAVVDSVPNFVLADRNSISQTYGQTVSPRDYLGGVSAWYFGHST